MLIGLTDCAHLWHSFCQHLFPCSINALRTMSASRCLMDRLLSLILVHVMCQNILEHFKTSNWHCSLSFENKGRECKKISVFHDLSALQKLVAAQEEFHQKSGKSKYLGVGFARIGTLKTGRSTVLISLLTCNLSQMTLVCMFRRHCYQMHEQKWTTPHHQMFSLCSDHELA